MDKHKTCDYKWFVRVVYKDGHFGSFWIWAPDFKYAFVLAQIEAPDSSIVVDVHLSHSNCMSFVHNNSVDGNFEA